MPQDTNEEAAVAANLPQMDLGICLTADAAHTTKANCLQLTQNNWADFLLFIKGNQPLALAKAEQLLPGLSRSFPNRQKELVEASGSGISTLPPPISVPVLLQTEILLA